VRAVLYCTNIVSRGIHRRVMSWWPSRCSWNRANLDDNRDDRALVVFIMMAAKWPSLSFSLWYPLASTLLPTFDCRLNWVDPNSEMIINRSDQIRSGSEQPVRTEHHWSECCFCIGLRCTKWYSIWSCFFLCPNTFLWKIQTAFPTRILSEVCILEDTCSDVLT